MERSSDLVIIGSGPAGLTAALYASRFGLKTMVVEGGPPGGKLLKTYLVDNYPGVNEIPGPDLAMSMYEQAMKFGPEIVSGEVVKVDRDKKVYLKDGTVINAQAVIAATGATERLLNIPGEQEALGHGESFCAICDGAFFRNQDIVVIGGGNSALEESEFLTRFGNKVTIVMRRPVFRADAKLQKQAKENPKIEFLMGYIPVEIKLDDMGNVSGLVIENVETKEQQTLECGGIFPYIGHIPNTDYLQDLGVLDEKGYIIADEHRRTTVPGIYAAGDAVRKELRQIVTATSDGAVAATSAYRDIME